jgi:nucleotide-binding universal stress UspA family protein
MAFKTILTIIQGEQDAERVLDCAIPLGVRFGSHLVGLHAEAMPIPHSSAIGFPDTEFLEVTAGINKERATRLEALFRSRVEAENLSFAWRSLESFSGDSALTGVTSARCADLVVAAQSDPAAESAASADIDTLLYEAGRPVRVTPHSGPSLSSYSRVLVAWNGTKEAARATFDALPFIIEAEGTEILVIDPPEDDDRNSDASGADIAAALSRHGANVAVATEQSGGLSVDKVIQNRIAATGSDLVVLGAYSHSWLREFLFGGVTRTALQSMPIATFLSR